jgi:hypothetical protein
MYFAESSRLINQNVSDKDAVKALDREIAHAYSPSGTGFTELPLLRNSTHLSQPDVIRLMGFYERLGVVKAYAQVQCPCGERYDGQEAECADCGENVTNANPTGVTCYSVLRSPLEPAYDPSAMSASPDVFVSYRHADAAKLAADIYYSLQAEGHHVFLDNGNIPVGANAEQVFLRAASRAPYFIVLVSENYFESPYCKKEISHAARTQRRLIRINVAPYPPAPNDMPWVDTPNWNSQQGDAGGLTRALETSLLIAVRTPSTANLADLREPACQYLLEQTSANDLSGVWNRLTWMRDITPALSKNDKIRQILQEVTPTRLPELCNALSP